MSVRKSGCRSTTGGCRAGVRSGRPDAAGVRLAGASNRPQGTGFYANTTPDTHRIPTPLDRFPPLGGGRRLDQLIDGLADRDGDQMVEWPSECANLGVGSDGQPMGRGELQMAERTLSGETGPVARATTDGSPRMVSDGEHDCVPEISATNLPSLWRHR